MYGTVPPAPSVRYTPVVRAVEQVLPTVVNIGTEKLVRVRHADPWRSRRGSAFDQFFQEFFGVSPVTPSYQRSQSLGSGVIVDPSGYILTNYHVIERATRIQVTLMDGQSLEGRLIAGDEVNDLALIKVDPPAPLPAVVFSADDDLLLGETVLALGNPFGLGHSVTMGVLSAKNRQATYEGEVLYRDILQTDAAVNPGSSGGPLVNLDGELMGINVAIYREAQNIGFAVPVKRARELLERWMSPKLLSGVWLGFSLAGDSGELAVTRVEPDGPAAANGLRPGDQIVKVRGREVGTIMDFNRLLIGLTPGSTVDFDVRRGEEDFWFTMRADPVPLPSGVQLARSRLGIGFANGTSVRRSPDSFSKGLVIDQVLENSPAHRIGLKPGLLITRINGFEIWSLDDVGRALERVASGDPVELEAVYLEEHNAFYFANSTLLRMNAQ